MSNLDWYKAKPITIEYLHSNYSYGDLWFSSMTLEGGLVGILHLAEFHASSKVQADLFILFKDIRIIGKTGEAHSSFIRYEVHTIHDESGLKRFKMEFDNGRIEIDYKDDLLYLCELPNGDFIEL